MCACGRAGRGLCSGVTSTFRINRLLPVASKKENIFQVKKSKDQTQLTSVPHILNHFQLDGFITMQTVEFFALMSIDSHYLVLYSGATQYKKLKIDENATNKL